MIVATLHAAWGFKSLLASGAAATSGGTFALCLSGTMIFTDLVCGGICFKIAYEQYFKAKEIDKIEKTIKNAIEDLENVEKKLQLELAKEEMHHYDLILVLKKLDEKLKESKQLLSLKDKHKDKEKEKEKKKETEKEKKNEKKNK